MKDTDSNPIRDGVLEVAVYISPALLHWSCCPVDYQPLWQLPVSTGDPFVFYPVLVWGSYMEACAIQHTAQQCWLLGCLLHSTHGRGLPHTEAVLFHHMLPHLFYMGFFPKRRMELFFQVFFLFLFHLGLVLNHLNITCRKRNWFWTDASSHGWKDTLIQILYWGHTAQESKLKYFDHCYGKDSWKKPQYFATLHFLTHKDESKSQHWEWRPLFFCFYGKRKWESTSKGHYCFSRCPLGKWGDHALTEHFLMHWADACRWIQSNDKVRKPKNLGQKEKKTFGCSWKSALDF